MAKKPEARPSVVDPGLRAFRVALLVVLVALALTTEERTFGTVADEQQVLYTGVSMAELGEIGVARGALFTVRRPQGDAVSPYGIGLSIVNALPALVAAPFERTFGAGASNTLFVLESILLVALAAAGAGLLARDLGAAPEGVALAVVGTALGSPLWAYAGANYSEPLQAAALALAVLFSGRAATAAEPRSWRFGAAAGCLAGVAVLAKGTNVVLFPFAALPLLFDGVDPWNAAGRRKRLLAFAAGAASSLGVWLAFEVVRFGRPLASYGGTGFTHPFLDGFWRLLIGPNKGIVFYFPLVVLALLGLSRLAHRGEVRGTFLALAGIPAAFLLLASAWFAWDGVVGWGPRLLVPGMPLLAAAAGASASTRATRFAGRVLVAAGVLVNALGVFQNEAATSAYLAAAPPLVVSEKEAARFPAMFVTKEGQGRPALSLTYKAAENAALSPFRVHLFLLGARLSGDPARLASPPWGAAHPEFVPTGAG
ncbi:MAG TPA: hypothetical protein VGR00_11455, partial [Thermoanaerobaculia bacterium]|nr:hypothetical protein [Thermoanaerobaculia bacterium]